MEYIVNNYYKISEPHIVNCCRIIYIDNAVKKFKLPLERAVCLANCFVNTFHLKCKYSKEIKQNIEIYLPIIFKNGIRVPEYNMNIIKEIKEKM